MRRGMILGLGLGLVVALTARVTRADERSAQPPVRATTTVEVIDDRAQVDDVISRLRREPAPVRKAEVGTAVRELKNDRATLDEETAAQLRRSEEPRPQKGAAFRRSLRERGAHPDRTERARRAP
jgi:hypothetical protein